MSAGHCARACALLVALACSGSLAAQSEQPDDPQIVVQGEREPPAQSAITEQARHISIIGNPLDDPLPRFEDRVCPGVLGLKDDAAAYIIDRIRYNAEQYDIAMHKDDGTCEPNLIVAFVDDAQNQLVQLARNQGYMLAGLSVTQRGELLNAPGAARVWVNTTMRSSTGMPIAPRSSTPERVVMSDPETGSSSSLDLPPVARGPAGSQSRISFPVREDIVSVLVLFDRAQVKGKSLLQLADYATMRGFAFTRETRGEVPADTILSLFDGDGPKPERLTPFDAAYLSSLYDGIPNIPAQSKIAGVNGFLKRQAAAPGD
jgi:hypothetical protein